MNKRNQTDDTNQSIFLIRLMFSMFTLFLVVMNFMQVAHANIKPKSKSGEGIAIVVNSDVITFSELNNSIKEAKQQFRPKNAKAVKELENEVVNMMIIEILQSQIAARNGIKVDPFEVDNAISDIARRNNATTAMLIAYLREVGQSINKFRENIRKQILASKVRDGVIQQVKITSQDVDLFMLSAEFQEALKNISKKTIKQTRVSHILVRVSKNLTDQQAQIRAQRLYERINGGESFELLARAQSDDPGSSAKGGNLGWALEGQFTPVFEKAMNSLSINKLSNIVKTNFGYHIIKVHERKEGAYTEEMRQNMAREMFFRKKASQIWVNWQDELLSQAFIEKRF